MNLISSSLLGLRVVMGRYAKEPDNATKSAKAKGSNLRVHFKVKKEMTKVDNTG